MLTYSSDLVQLPALKMHYGKAGHGKNTVIFVHGYTSSCRSWRPVMESLPEDFRAFAVDVRGSGDSEKHRTGHTVKQMTEDIYEFARALSLKDITIVGHSMGGAISMAFALDHQELLRSFIMVNPAPCDGLSLTPEMKQMFMSILKSRNKEGIAQLMTAMGFAPDAPIDKALVDEAVEDALKASEAFLDQAMADMEGLHMGARLAEIEVPALMVHGDRDAAVPLAEAIKTFQLIPGCSLQVFYGCGHTPQIEAKDDFVRLLVSFVRNPRRRAEIAQ